MIDIEQIIIPEIEQHASYFRKVRDGVYQTRCPICGDSQSKMNTGHFYILTNRGGKCTCYCHKCNFCSQLNTDLLTKLIGPHNFQLDNQRLRKISPGNSSVPVETDVLDRRSAQYRYLKARMGCDFSDEEMKRLRLIADQEEFFQKYNIQGIQPMSGYITFVSSDGNTLCCRNMIENDQYRWIKRVIYPQFGSSPYTIRSGIDILSNEQQILVLAEGIFDVIGVYKHLIPSAGLYAAALGKDYSKVIRWMVGKGIFGKNMRLHIYSDQDVPFSKLKNELRKYRWLFECIAVYYNDADHDFGVQSGNIILQDPKFI